MHDVGPYADRRGKPLLFEPGMVTTVEPGLYLRAGRAVPARYRGIGVRIEDDVAVTRDGNVVLTGAVPKDIKGIERVCAGG